MDDILANFELVICPAGYGLKFCGYTREKSQQLHVSFIRECASCLNKNYCRARIHKRVSTVTVSVKPHEYAKQQRFMEAEEFRSLFRIWNGVDTVSSMFKCLYHVDRRLVRG